MQHGVYIGIVQHKEALWVLHRVALLLQYAHAEAVEGVYVARIVVAGKGVYALAHLICGFVCECYAEYVARQYAKLVNKVSETP